jgi:hypothetical protein
MTADEMTLYIKTQSSSCTSTKSKERLVTSLAYFARAEPCSNYTECLSHRPRHSRLPPRRGRLVCGRHVIRRRRRRHALLQSINRRAARGERVARGGLEHPVRAAADRRDGPAGRELRRDVVLVLLEVCTYDVSG